MGFVEFIAFFRALPEMVKILGEVNSTLKQLRQDSIDKEISEIKNEFSIKLQTLKGAVNDEQRKKALLDLERAVSR